MMWSETAFGRMTLTDSERTLFGDFLSNFALVLLTISVLEPVLKGKAVVKRVMGVVVLSALLLVTALWIA